MPSSDPRSTHPSPSVEDEVVIDLTDGPTAAQEAVIDLRDGAAETAPAKVRPPSGRPPELAPGLELVELAERDERWMKAERFVYDIYRASGFCEESPRGVVEELQEWTDFSRFHVVFDEDGEVVGTVRAILAPFALLPVGKFERTDHLDADPLVELSSLCVAPTARGLSVVVHLCRAMMVTSMRRGASALVFATDDWMVDLLAGAYHLPVRQIGVRRFYMGADITPMTMSLHGTHFERTARDNPAYWQWMTEAFTPEEVARWELPIVLTDHASTEHDTAAAETTTR